MMEPGPERGWQSRSKADGLKKKKQSLEGEKAGTL